MDLTEALMMYKISLPCSEKQIQNKYKELLLKYHPDRNPEQEAWCHQRIMEISQAQDLIIANKSLIQDSAWESNYQVFEESIEEHEGSKAEQYKAINKNISKLILKEIHIILQTYYNYGLENRELRNEGVRRFRYREVLRNLKKLAEKMKRQELQHSSHYHFIKTLYTYIYEPLPAQDLSGNRQVKNAFISVRDAAIECEKIIKEYFLSYKLPSLQNFYAALKIIIVISASYPKENWAKTTQFFIEFSEAFLALLEYHYS